MSFGKNNSFTLIELLVVIAIIGLLSSIVLVATKGSRDKARIAKGLEFSQTIQNTIGSEAVGIWRFEQNSLDSSGYNNHGTVTGAVYTDGILGSALSFDGVDDYVDCGSGDALNIQGPLTISAWINPSTGMTGSAYYDIVVKNSIYSSGYGIEIYGIFNKVEFWTRGVSLKYATSWQYGSLDNIIGNWYHLVGVYDGTNSWLYINGVATGGGLAGVNPGDTAAQHLRIGRGGTYFHGLIDEVQIYSQALSTSKIQQLYAEGLERHKDLVTK